MRFTEQEILNAGKHYGLDIMKLPHRRRRMLTVMYHYSQGWIDEADLEKKMRIIFRDNIKSLIRK